MEGYCLVGLMFALPAKPMPPMITAARSVRMSPKRFEHTTTSNICGERTKFIAAASTSMELDFTPGYSRATSAKTASQKTMLYLRALDFVTLVTCFRSLPSAVSKA